MYVQRNQTFPRETDFCFILDCSLGESFSFSQVDLFWYCNIKWAILLSPPFSIISPSMQFVPFPSLRIPKDATLEKGTGKRQARDSFTNDERNRLMPFLCTSVCVTRFASFTQGAIVASSCITDFKIAFAECCFLAGRISVSWSYIRIISRSKGGGEKRIFRVISFFQICDAFRWKEVYILQNNVRKLGGKGGSISRISFLNIFRRNKTNILKFLYSIDIQRVSMLDSDL